MTARLSKSSEKTKPGWELFFSKKGMTVSCHRCAQVMMVLHFLFVKDQALVLMRTSYVGCPTCHAPKLLPHTMETPREARAQLRELQTFSVTPEELLPLNEVFSTKPKMVLIAKYNHGANQPRRNSL